MPDVKHISVNGITYDIPTGGGTNIAMVDALAYSTDHYTFSYDGAVTDGMYLIFKPDTSSTVAMAIDFSNVNYIEITNTFDNAVYKLNKWGKAQILTNGCYIVARFDSSDTNEFNIIGVFPVYPYNGFQARNINRKFNTENTDVIPGSHPYLFAYIYSYKAASDITVFDENDNDITENCTIKVASGITRSNGFVSRIFIQTASAVRIKSIILKSVDYGMPTDYDCGTASSAKITGFFEYDPTANLQHRQTKWTISEYAGNDPSYTGTYHAINCI